jgi:hypothetical protein
MRPIKLRIATIIVLTVLLGLFTTVTGINSRAREAVPEYAPIIDRLPGHQPQSGDPIYFHASSVSAARVNTAAIRRAARIVPDDATFFVSAPESQSDVVQAARLFFLPALPSRHAARAEWILSYRSTSLPNGFEPVRIYHLDKDLLLTNIRRR